MLNSLLFHYAEETKGSSQSSGPFRNHALPLQTNPLWKCALHLHFRLKGKIQASHTYFIIDRVSVQIHPLLRRVTDTCINTTGCAVFRNSKKVIFAGKTIALWFCNTGLKLCFNKHIKNEFNAGNTLLLEYFFIYILLIFQGQQQAHVACFTVESEERQEEVIWVYRGKCFIWKQWFRLISEVRNQPL